MFNCINLAFTYSPHILLLYVGGEIWQTNNRNGHDGYELRIVGGMGCTPQETHKKNTFKVKIPWIELICLRKVVALFSTLLLNGFLAFT